MALTIEARCGATNARAGRLRTAHGDVRTPAFVPLATKATIKGLLPAEVRALGYDMVLGNTFHLMLSPGAELIERFGGLHGFMDWDGPIVTDSGGFQVFSMGHGTIADEIKSRPFRARHGEGATREGATRKGARREGATREGATQGATREGATREGATREGATREGARREGVRREGATCEGATQGATREGATREGAILSIEEQGVRFRSYVDGSERFLSPEGSMAVQASLHSDIALVFDECTPFHVDREYTERSTERTHRWLERCLTWHSEHGAADQLVYGIVQGGVYEDMRRASARIVASSGCDGVAIGGSLGAEKAQMYEVVGYAVGELGDEHERLPRHLLGIGDVDDLIRGVELGIDTFDCAMPTRLGRHGTALVHDPENRWRVDLTKSVWRSCEEPLMEGCACHACKRGLSRAYLSYLVRASELTGMRMLTEHNLAFLARLMGDLREGILDGQFSETATRLRGE